MAAPSLLVTSLLLSSLLQICSGNLFSTLQRTLIITASPKAGDVLKGGEDKIRVSWSLNQTFPAGTDSAYKTVKVKLCYAPISQEDRAWRKTVDNLKKDKTCQFKVAAQPYKASNNSVEWVVERDVPTATYFIRAYAYGADEQAVAYGQTTDAHKTTNLFEIEAISGRHASLDIAAVCFSAFSIISLAGFFFVEKRKARVPK